MDFAPAYLIQRFFYRFVDFFHHWYVDGSRYFGHKFITLLRDVDKTLAVKTTLQHFFEPLYRDYSIIGRILGVIFRTGRIIVSLILYIFITVVAVLLYIIWLLIPALPLIYAAINLQ